MKYKNIYFIVFSYTVSFVLLLSCSTTKQLQFVKKETNSIELGAIVKKEGALKNNIEIKGLPVLDKEIRVSIVEKEFTKASFGKYIKIFDRQKASIVLDEASSPTYYVLELIDDIGYASSINTDIDTRTYVKNSKKAGVVSQISMISKRPISVADVTAAFLEMEGDQYRIRLYKQEELLETLPFSEMIIFDYQTSFFCYGKNERNQVVVMDITEEGKTCKRPLERKARKLETIKRLVDY